MEFQLLKKEIETDPLGRGYSAMTPEQLAADLNTHYRQRLVPLSSAELLAWAAGGADDTKGRKCRYERIEDAASQHAKSAIRGIAKAAIKLIERDNTVLDLNLDDRKAMVAALVAAGVLTTEEENELHAKATQPISRAEELGLPAVFPAHVRRIRS